MNIDTESIAGYTIIKEDESNYSSEPHPSRSCHPLGTTDFPMGASVSPDPLY